METPYAGSLPLNRVETRPAKGYFAKSAKKSTPQPPPHGPGADDNKENITNTGNRENWRMQTRKQMAQNQNILKGRHINNREKEIIKIDHKNNKTRKMEQRTKTINK